MTQSLTKEVASVRASRPAPPPPPMGAGERLIFWDGGVLVTNARITALGATYAMGTVSSVQVQRIPTVSLLAKACTLVASVGFLIFALLKVFPIAAAARWPEFAPTGAIGLAIAMLGLAAWLQWRLPPRFGVRLGMTSEAVDILTSTDERWIQSIQQAIQIAMIELAK